MRVALSFAVFLSILPAQSELGTRQRDTLERQGSALANLERAIEKGKASLTAIANWKNALASLRNELQRAGVPLDHPQSAALMARVGAFETKLGTAEQAAAATAWANVEQTFVDVEAKIEKLQHERELRPLHKRLDEIAAFAATRAGDPQAGASSERIAALKARAETRLAEQGAEADRKAALVDPKNYPTLQTDFAELDGVFERFKSITDIRRDPAATATMCKAWKPAAEFHAHCLTTYEALLATDSQLARDVRARIQRAGEALIGFRALAVEFQKATPPAIRAALAKADELAAKGKAEQRPAFFVGGVRQQLDGAREWLGAYAAIRGDDDGEVVGLRAEIAAATQRIDALAATLAEQILAEARPPEDVYRGSDRAALEQQLRAAWTKKHPGDEILAVRFHMAAWKRDLTSTWSGSSKSWSHSDTSVLCVTIVVRTSPTLAMSHPAYLNRDNLSEGSITIGVDTKGDAYVSTAMLVANVLTNASPR